MERPRLSSGLNASVLIGLVTDTFPRRQRTFKRDRPLAGSTTISEADMTLLSILGVFAAAMFGRVAFLYLEARAAYSRRAKQSGSDDRGRDATRYSRVVSQ